MQKLSSTSPQKKPSLLEHKPLYYEMKNASFFPLVFLIIFLLFIPVSSASQFSDFSNNVESINSIIQSGNLSNPHLPKDELGILKNTVANSSHPNHISLSEFDLIDVDLSLYAETDFVSTWQTNLTTRESSESNQVSLPLESNGTYDFTVDWGDGLSDTISSWAQSEKTHTYSTEGQYVVTINGIFSGWRFADTGDRLKIVEINQWGNLNLGNSGYYFSGAENLVLSTTDALDLNGTTSLENAFNDATNLGTSGNLNSWDVSNVIGMSRMFKGAVNFNQPLDAWNVSKVTDTSLMFSEAISFNQLLNSWNVSSVTNMDAMFGGAISFNQSLNSWNVSQVRTMHGMFLSTRNFNQPLDAWDVSQVTHMGYMFSKASSFNQPIDSWNISQVKIIWGMFSEASSFNQPLNSWETSHITTSYAMFQRASSFNQSLNSWDVSNITNMRFMFDGASSFNQPLNSWDVSNVTYMGNIFEGASIFNQSLDTWNVSQVTDMRYMFEGASSFNQSLNSWNVSKVTSMSGMFKGASSFNQLLDAWDVSQVTDMRYMFEGASSFNQPLDAWDVSQVTDMRSMFSSSSLTTENYDILLIGWSQLHVQSGVIFDAGDVKYSDAAESARNTLIETYNWTINDGGSNSPSSADDPAQDGPQEDEPLATVGSFTLFIMTSIALIATVFSKRRLQKFD